MVQNTHVWTEQSDLFLQFVSLKDLEKEGALSETFWEDYSKGEGSSSDWDKISTDHHTT